MTFYFSESFEIEYINKFKNTEFNLNDTSVIISMTKKYPNYKNNINAWVWLKDCLQDPKSKEKIQFIIDNWSNNLIQNIIY
jgi:hypothetical protein